MIIGRLTDPTSQKINILYNPSRADASRAMDLLLTSSTNAAQRATQGIAIMYYAIGITCQTFLYGIYTSLAIFSIYSMIKTGLKNSMRKYLFIMSIFMFFISTLYWISKLLDLLQKIQNGIIDNNPPSTSLTTSPITHFELILGSVALMNYALTDGVVLWRAWAICSDEYRSWLYVPLFFLCCACKSLFNPSLMWMEVPPILESRN
ncbi:hypothetical protein E1B28_009413 [Marasmius oreades]|uniref:Uncharacterized protein n=1 Tax=Marasmius oreades TaxID=181124 RepID=A0A9P7S123_9AGAR|nr:uncharacterized protein E1B28_009413 [Marasmius oreades]KAG7093130.1 hypothetical protein E1B28_009413 [Marasmius oreades]